MATFETVGVVLQVIENIYGLVNDMRDNAAGYKTQAAVPGADLAALAAVMRADANLYLGRIGWISSLAIRNSTMLSNALGIFGMTISDAVNLRTTLTSVCNHTLAAALNTQDNINTESDYITANVPSYERLW